MSNLSEVIAQMESEGQWANFQIFVSTGLAALLTYFTIHFYYIHSHLAILLIPTCAAVTSVFTLGLATIAILLLPIDKRGFYYLTYLPILAGFAAGILLSIVLLNVGRFELWTQPSWLPTTLAVLSGPLIVFMLFIICEITIRSLIRVLESIAGVQTYKIRRNMLAYDDLGAAIFYAFPTFLLWSSIAGLAIGGLALL